MDYQKLCFAARRTASLITLCWLAVGLAHAQTDSYPNKPIRLIVPFTPGGSTDLLARAIGQELSKSLGQPVLIDNVPGAGGSLGADKVAKANADGYTLLMGHIGTLAVNPSMYPKLPYQPLKDFAPVAWVARVPNVLAVNPNTGISSLKDFVNTARAKPGSLNYSSGGNGSAAHITMELLKWKAQIPLVHIPYRGAAPAVTDLLAGHMQASFTGIPVLLPHIRSGKLKAIAVSSPHRLPQLPDVPTVAESGLAGTKGFEADQWYGVVTPSGTPSAIIQKLNTQINAALNSNEVKTKFASEGAQATPSTPEAFTKLISSEIPRWSSVIRAASIKPD